MGIHRDMGEYYKAFADTVVPPLQRVYQEIFAEGCGVLTFNEAVVSLIPQTVKEAVDPPTLDL